MNNQTLDKNESKDLEKNNQELKAQKFSFRKFISIFLLIIFAIYNSILAYFSIIDIQYRFELKKCYNDYNFILIGEDYHRIFFGLSFLLIIFIIIVSLISRNILKKHFGKKVLNIIITLAFILFTVWLTLFYLFLVVTKTGTAC